MDRLTPLKPHAESELGSGTRHGTAKAARRTGPMHPHALVVSIHDVSPRTRDVCQAMLTDLASLGLPTCSLLVVPDHHGHGHFLEDDDFCSWLTEQAQTGHEIVMHGYFHWRTPKENESWLVKLTTGVYTASEGEFYDIDHDTAMTLVNQAREDFRQIGLAPDGFVAPAWLLSAAGEKALCDAGCEYTTRLRAVTDLRIGQRYDSQSLVWSVRNGWRRFVSRIWNAWLFRSLRGNPLMRISIHPVDATHGAIWKQIRQCVREALRDRAPFTYERWISRERTFRVTVPR